MTAAYLYAQLEHGQEINGERLKWWNMYHRALAPLEEQGVLRRPCVLSIARITPTCITCCSVPWRSARA